MGPQEHVWDQEEFTFAMALSPLLWATGLNSVCMQHTCPPWASLNELIRIAIPPRCKASQMEGIQRGRRRSSEHTRWLHAWSHGIGDYWHSIWASKGELSHETPFPLRNYRQMMVFSQAGAHQALPLPEYLRIVTVAGGGRTSLQWCRHWQRSPCSCNEVWTKDQ